MNASASNAVVRAVREALHGHSAHVDLERALTDLPRELRGVRPAGHDHSIWELVEHLRIAQEDLAAYALSADASSPAWPDGYWPEPLDPVDDARWQASVDALTRSLAAMEAWLDDPDMDLGADLPWSSELPSGGRRTALRQVLVACEHMSYHLGQIVQIRKVLGAW